MKQGKIDVTVRKEFKQLARTIAELTRQTDRDWISWRQVARAQEGSGAASIADELSGWALLPEAGRYFVVSGSSVKLTAEGYRLAESSKMQDVPLPHTIASAVKRYAGNLSLHPLRLVIEDISSLGSAEHRYVYAVSIKLQDDIILTESHVELHSEIDSTPTNGRVVGQEPDGRILYVAFESRVYRSVLPAQLYVDRGYLLRQLAEAISQLSDIPEHARPLLEGQISAPSLAHTDSIQLAEELLRIEPPFTRFLWGPPGAGKTYGLAHLVRRLVEREPDSRILLVAPANLAVDVALEKVVAQMEASLLQSLIEQRKVLRFGYPRKQQILETPELLGPADLDVYSSEVKRVSQAIRQAEREGASEQQLSLFRTELLEAQEKLKVRVQRHVEQCRIVATTTTLAYLASSPIAKLKWNTVLVDEVTMVPPAMCIYLGALAIDRLVLAGDPRQLGPVFEHGYSGSATSFEWMGRDVFDKSQISVGSGVDREVRDDDPRLARITSQRRCDTEIWRTVRPLYRGVKNLADQEALGRFRRLAPAEGYSVVLLNTASSSDKARCEKRHRSWQNPFTAELALEVASSLSAQASEEISVAIITPYRAQVRLLRTWMQPESRIESPTFASLQVGTVHQFQGSEADIVIFDLVDGVGRTRLGKLLRGDTGIRLATVAATRARGKLILIADSHWYARNMKPEDNRVLWWLLFDKDLCSIPVKPLQPNSIPAIPQDSFAFHSLWTAIQKVGELNDMVQNHIIRDENGALIARADFAVPELRFAVYCDDAHWYVRGNTWQRDFRLRHRLAEYGWTLKVFSATQIRSNIGGCIAQIMKARRRCRSKPGTSIESH